MPNSDHSDQSYELNEDVSASPYYNPDIAPTKKSERTWGTWDYAALWISMSACIPSYALASGMISQGMNWYQAVITVVLGNMIILVPLILIAHAGTRYGISFPVLCRASFGIRGANVAAMLRMLVACCWFGILCWIGGQGLYIPLTILFPSLQDSPKFFAEFNLPEMICFFAFWSMNILLIYRGIESIRSFLKIAAPILIIAPILLVIWAISQAGGLAPIFNAHNKLIHGRDSTEHFWSIFVPSLAVVIGFWSTLVLNIPDFSRFAKSQQAQKAGQTLGLPITMGLYALVGVIVTCATVVIYTSAVVDPWEPSWDPIELLSKANQPALVADHDNAQDETKAPVADNESQKANDISETKSPLVKPHKVRPQPSSLSMLVAVLAAIVFTTATLTTNIAANVVGPANSFANLFPKHISFKTGGLITGIIGIALQPWKIYLASDFTNWLNGYSILLGAIAGILIVDYYLIRKRWIDLPELYRVEGRYWYSSGFNFHALIALIAGIVPCLPGYLQQNNLLDYGNDSIWVKLYFYGWFFSLVVAGLVYGVLMKAVKTSSQ